MNDFEIIKSFLEGRKNLSYTLNQIAMIVKLSSQNTNKNYSKSDVIRCLQKNNIKILELISYEDLLYATPEPKEFQKTENIFINLTSFKSILLLSILSYSISPSLMTVIMSFVLLYEINKEKISNIKSFFEVASIFGLIYTLIFNFFSYDLFNDFDSHISIYPFDPMLFTITTLLYYGICNYKFTIISILFPFFLYLSYKTSILISLFSTIIVSIIILCICSLFEYKLDLEYFKTSINRYLENAVSFILAVIIMTVCNVIQQKDDLYYKLHKSKNMDYCSNINKDFEIIKRSTKNGFIVIDSKKIKFEEVIAYLILNKQSKSDRDFKFDDYKFSYNYLVDLMKNENFLRDYKIKNNKEEFYKIKKMLQDPKIFNSLKKEANLIDVRTLKVIEYYINLTNKERFFYYKCE
jgi:hypothetical protein